MMHPDFFYPPEEDKLIFRNSTFILANKRLRITACTIQGSLDGLRPKPNEDAFSIAFSSKGLVMSVFDGCSSPGSVAWLTDKDKARFASHLVKTQFENIVHEVPFRDLLPRLNSELAQEAISHQSSKSLSFLSLPTTTATVISIDGSARYLQLGHLGDSFCVVYYHDGSSQLITVDANAIYEKQIMRKIMRHARKAAKTPRQCIDTPAIQKLFQDRAKKTHNRQDGTGQGILNGDPAAVQYIQQGRIPLSNVHAILLGTDGLLPPDIDRHTASGQAKLLTLLEQGDLQAIITRKQSVENDDIDWNIVRTKHSDDATGVYVALETA